MKIERLAPFISITLFVLVLCSCVPSVGEAEGWPGVSWHEGILYTASGDGTIMAVNSSARLDGRDFPSLADGEWSFRIDVPGGGVGCGPSSVPAAFYSAPVAGEDLVYACTYNGEIRAMSPSARSENLTFPHARSGEWRKAVPGNIVGSPVIDGNILYVPSSDGTLYALDAVFDGDEIWKSEPLGDKLWTGPAIEGAFIYVSTFEDDVYALPTEGALPGKDVGPSWTFKGDAGFVSSPVVYEALLFIGSFDNNLYGIELWGSEPKWKFLGRDWFWAAPVVNEGIVYAGCLDGKVYALDAETGDELWEFDTESRVVASPVLADDLLVVACDSGEVYILRTDDLVDGRLASDPISIGAPIRGSICAQEGIAYIRAENDRLYALDISKGKISWEFPLTTE